MEEWSIEITVADLQDEAEVPGEKLEALVDALEAHHGAAFAGPGRYGVRFTLAGRGPGEAVDRALDAFWLATKAAAMPPWAVVSLSAQRGPELSRQLEHPEMRTTSQVRTSHDHSVGSDVSTRGITERSGSRSEVPVDVGIGSPIVIVVAGPQPDRATVANLPADDVPVTIEFDPDRIIGHARVERDPGGNIIASVDLDERADRVLLGDELLAGHYSLLEHADRSLEIGLLRPEHPAE